MLANQGDCRVLHVLFDGDGVELLFDVPENPQCFAVIVLLDLLSNDRGHREDALAAFAKGLE